MCVIALKKRVIIEKYMLHMCRTCLRFVTFLSFLQYHSDPVIVDCTSMSSVLTGRANSWFCNVLMEFFLVWCDGKLQNSSWMDLVVRFLFSKFRTTFELLSQRGRDSSGSQGTKNRNLYIYNWTNSACRWRACDMTESSRTGPQSLSSLFIWTDPGVSWGADQEKVCSR